MACPLVSAIVPNFNHAQYLDLRLTSVLNQTYPNFEVIILDDCSTDSSLEVIGKYKDDIHVSAIVVNEQNSGNTFKQWENGISQAKGDIIWIAESDDYCELDFLEKLVRLYSSRDGIVAAYSEVIPVDENGRLAGVYRKLELAPIFTKSGFNARNIINHFKSDYRNLKYHDRIMSGDEFLLRYMSLDCFVQNTSGAIFSKSSAMSIPGQYMSAKAAGDYYFWYEMSCQGDIALDYNRLSYFRQHPGSVTDRRNADGSNMAAEKEILDMIENRCHLGYFRKRLIMARHSERFRNIQYVDERVKQRVYEMWNVYGFTGVLDGFLCSISRFLYERFRIKI